MRLINGNSKEAKNLRLRKTLLNIMLENHSNYHHVDEDSFYWTNLKMLLHWAESMVQGNDLENYSDRLILGLKNTIKNGYELQEKCIDPIVETNRELLKQRSNVGVKKYNTTLEQNNTDDFLVHFLQELLDGANYVQKLIQQNGKEKEANGNRETN